MIRGIPAKTCLSAFVLIALLLFCCALPQAVRAETVQFAGGTITADYRIVPRVKPGATITGTIDITVSGIRYDQITFGQSKMPRGATVGAGLVYYDLETAAAEVGASSTKDLLQRLYDQGSTAPLRNYAGSRGYPITRDGAYRLVLERDLQVVAPQKEGSYVYFLAIGIPFAATKFSPEMLARVPVEVTAQAGAATPTGPDKRIELSGTPSISPTDVRVGEEFIIEVPYRVTGLPMTGGQTVPVTEQTQITGPSSQPYSRTRQLTSNTGETDVPSKFRATVRRAGR